MKLQHEWSNSIRPRIVCEFDHNNLHDGDKDCRFTTIMYIQYCYKIRINMSRGTNGNFTSVISGQTTVAHLCLYFVARTKIIVSSCCERTERFKLSFFRLRKDEKRKSIVIPWRKNETTIISVLFLPFVTKAMEA